MRADASTQDGYAVAEIGIVLEALLARVARRKTPLLAGLSGLQGAGKSTFARQLAATARTRGVACVVLSLDDFYLGRRERRHLARDVHSLFLTRGVPGTHDLGLLERVLDALAHASPTTPARVPRFDKGHDTRLPPSRWRRVDEAPALIVLEGWCVGVPAQAPATLRRPLNALERSEDADGRWRRHVNDALAHGYRRLWRRLDALVLLQAPGWNVVTRWRGEQEQSLHARRAPQAMDPARLARFLMHYERLSRVALRELPALAGIRILLDRQRRVREIHIDRA